MQSWRKCCIPAHILYLRNLVRMIPVYLYGNWMRYSYANIKYPGQNAVYARICYNPVTKTRLYSFDPLKPHFYIVKLGLTGVYIIFIVSAQNIDCGTVQSSVKLTILPVCGLSSPGPRSFRSRSTVVPVNIAVSVGPFQSLYNHDRRSVPFHSIMFALLL